MPWPMIHFAIAVEMYEHKPSGAFLLGSVGPDAPLVREDHREAKMRSHLVTANQLPDVQDFTDLYTRCVTEETEPDYREYILGYISHIYTDGRWDDCKREITAAMQGKEEAPRAVLMREENQLDRNLYRGTVWAQRVRLDVEAAPIYEIEGLYEPADLEEWRRQLFAFLEDEKQEPGIELQYLTEEFAADFVRQVAAELRDMFEGFMVAES